MAEFQSLSGKRSIPRYCLVVSGGRNQFHASSMNGSLYIVFSSYLGMRNLGTTCFRRASMYLVTLT